MASFQLMVTDGPDLGRTIPLEDGTTLVGRFESSHPHDPVGSRRLTLIDKTVSRTHAQIYLSPFEGPNLVHLSETNDTFVNGEKVVEITLLPGNVIRMGQTTMELQQESGWVRSVD